LGFTKILSLPQFKASHPVTTQATEGADCEEQRTPPGQCVE